MNENWLKQKGNSSDSLFFGMIVVYEEPEPLYVSWRPGMGEMDAKGNRYSVFHHTGFDSGTIFQGYLLIELLLVCVN